MIPLFGVIIPMMQALWGRLRELRADDRGMTTEAVIITAALAGLAIIVTGIIIRAVTREAEQIDVDVPNR